MPGASAGGHLREWRIIRDQRTSRRVEVVHQQLVHPQVGHDCKPVVVGQFDLVRVRALLTLEVGSAPTMLNHRRCVAEFAAGEYRKDGYAATVIICYQDIFSRLVQGDVARSSAARRDPVQEGKLARSAIDGKSADAAALLTVIV